MWYRRHVNGSRIAWAAAIIGFLGLGALAEHAYRERRRKRRPLDEEEAGDEYEDLDLVDLPEPPGIEYDQRLPCVTDEDFLLREGDEDGAEGCIHPSQLEPMSFQDVPFAEGVERPAWPVVTSHPRDLQVSYVDMREKWHGRWGREFGASRKSVHKKTKETIERHHEGVDLFAEEGDEVVSMEAGRVVAILPFHHGTWAIYVQNDTGDVVVYGEVEKGSWWPYGVQKGSRVMRGQKMARIGKMRVSSMLHLEAYEPVEGTEALIDDIRHRRLRWIQGDPPPEELLDPTHYLLAAQHTALEEEAHGASHASSPPIAAFQRAF